MLYYTFRFFHDGEGCDRQNDTHHTLLSPPSLKTRVGGVFPPFQPAPVHTTHGDEKNRHRLQVLITRERTTVTMKDGRPFCWLKYCTISIDSASHMSQGLWSGPNFGQCHMSYWLWSHARNDSKKTALRIFFCHDLFTSTLDTTIISKMSNTHWHPGKRCCIPLHEKNLSKFWLKILFVTSHNASGLNVEMRPLCHKSHPRPNRSKWYSMSFFYCNMYIFSN